MKKKFKMSICLVLVATIMTTNVSVAVPSLAWKALFKDTSWAITRIDNSSFNRKPTTKDGENCFEWPFNGDLTKRFKIGDVPTFQFNVCEEYKTDEYVFEFLDYFVESYKLLSNNKAASIDNYLIME